MEEKFYQANTNEKPTAPVGKPTAVPDSDTLATLLAGNPELLAKILMSIQSANTR